MADYSKLLGYGVISIEEGVRCGKVVDFLIDYRKCQVLGLIVKGGWSKDAEVVSYKDVESIGIDVVMILNSKAVRAASKVPEAAKAISDHVNIAKLEVITRQGHIVGKVATFEFAPDTGKIQQFEVGGSVLKNIFDDRAFGERYTYARLGRTDRDSDRVLVGWFSRDFLTDLSGEPRFAVTEYPYH